MKSARTFRVCPNCSSQDFGWLPGYKRKKLVRCPDCLLIFDIRIPSEQDLNDFYDTYSYSGSRECPAATLASYHRLLESFEKWRSCNRILDVGCGQGDFLLAAKSRGWEVFGTEYSPSACNLCEARGLTIHNGRLSRETFKNTGFDIITSFEVFEHINNGAGEMKIIAEKLRVKGLFYLTTPNFNSLLRYLEGENFKMLGYPEHICFYTPSSIKKLAQRYKFHVHKVETTGMSLGRMRSAVLEPRSLSKDKKSSCEARSDEWRKRDSRLRELAQENIGLRILKSSANMLLSLSGKGDTLKAWLVKSGAKSRRL